MTPPDLSALAEGLSEGERLRLLMGRTDWRDADWQDHCGDPNCDHCMGWVDQHVAPNWLSDTDQALRAHLTKEKNDADQ